MAQRLALLILLLLIRDTSRAQFEDDFEDGNVSSSPVWTGDLDRWIVEDGPESRRLATRGLPRSDTLLLQTPTHGPFGTWKIRYGHSGGPLSNFNQVRIHVWAAEGEDDGYYLLIGSNDRTVKLYRSTGGTSTGELLAAAANDLLDDDDVDVRMRIEHAYSGDWRVWVDDSLVLEASKPDRPVAENGFFRLWVKHTTSRGSDHWFDDVTASGIVESDTTAPRLSAATPVSTHALFVRFTEPVTTASACHAGSVSLDRTGPGRISVRCPASSVTDTLWLESSAPFPAGSNRLTAYDITDPSGNVTPVDTLAFDVADIGLPPASGDLVINEIDFAPSPAESEFVEILNRSQKRIDLSRIRIADDRTEAALTAFRSLLEPQSLVVVTRDHAALATRFPGVEAIEVDGWPSLNNGGDTVTLLHETDTLDSVVYTPAGGSVGSLERIDPRLPSDLPHNWLSSVAAGGATPGKVNSVHAPDVSGPDLVFVEQTSPVALRAVFSEAVPTAGVRTGMFNLNGAAPRLVAPGVPRYSADYFLAFDAVHGGTLVATGIADAAGNVTDRLDSPINLLPRPGELVVNEIMFEPRIDEFDGLPDQIEYVELSNISSFPITLNTCTLEGPKNEDGVADTMPLRSLPHGLAGRGFAVVVDAKVSAASSTFLDNVPAPHVRPLVSGSLNLRNQGSRLVLSCSGEEMDSAGFNPDWHHPALLVSRGVSLERISAQAPSDDPRSWTSSTDPSGGTPGRSNSASTPEWTPAAPVDINPSPFSSDGQGGQNATTISYRLRSDRAFVRITIFNSRGRAIRHLTRGKITPRASAVVWDGRDDSGHSVPTGIYIVFIEATDSYGGSVEQYRAPVVAVRGFK